MLGKPIGRQDQYAAASAASTSSSSCRAAAGVRVEPIICTPAGCRAGCTARCCSSTRAAARGADDVLERQQRAIERDGARRRAAARCATSPTSSATTLAAGDVGRPGPAAARELGAQAPARRRRVSDGADRRLVRRRPRRRARRRQAARSRRGRVPAAPRGAGDGTPRFARRSASCARCRCNFARARHPDRTPRAPRAASEWTDARRRLRRAPAGARSTRCRARAVAELGEIALPRIPQREAGLHDRQRRQRLDSEPHGRRPREEHDRPEHAAVPHPSLNDNMSIMTALANDLGYEHVFSEQLKNSVRAGDVLVVDLRRAATRRTCFMRCATRGGSAPRSSRCWASTAAPALDAGRPRDRRALARLRHHRGHPPDHQPHPRGVLLPLPRELRARAWCSRCAPRSSIATGRSTCARRRTRTSRTRARSHGCREPSTGSSRSPCRAMRWSSSRTSAASPAGS